MGKRELVLIAVFVALGFVVYQVTAPPPAPGSEAVSFGGIFRNMKRGIQGAREVATVDSQQTVPVDRTVAQLRVNVSRTSDLTVTGEDRADLAVQLHITGRGFDQAEAKAVANAVTVKVERVGDAVVVSLDTATSRGTTSQMVIDIKVPRRLTMRMQPHIGRLVATALAGVEIMGSRGETRITGLTGRLVLTHSGGALEIDGVPSLKLNARNSRGTVKNAAGEVAVDAISGDLAFTGIAGPLEIEGRNTDIRIDGIKALKGALRVNNTGGDIRIEGLRSEARIDGRNSVIEVVMAAAAPVTIYNLGDIRVTAPPGGYTLDAMATEGRITLQDGDIKPSEGNDARAAGAVRGGGPSLTLRSTRGGITVRKAGGAEGSSSVVGRGR